MFIRLSSVILTGLFWFGYITSIIHFGNKIELNNFKYDQAKPALVKLSKQSLGYAQSFYFAYL